MPMSNPAVFINAYLSEMVPRYLAVNGSESPSYFVDGALRFIPTSPTMLEAITSSFSESDAPIATFERMLKMRRRSFPHIKCEQMLYYFYKQSGSSNIASMIETQAAIADLLNRGDESAEEVNSWIRSKLDSNSLYIPVAGGPEFDPIYFHEFKVFQLEETRDIIDFGTAQVVAGNKIIIDYEYHQSVDFNATPENFDTKYPPL